MWDGSTPLEDLESTQTSSSVCLYEDVCRPLDPKAIDSPWEEEGDVGLESHVNGTQNA